MEISIRRLSEVQIIQIRGAVRLGVGVDSFRQAMEDAFSAGDTRLVINFAEVPMIDSSGIGVLVKAMASAKQRGGGVKLLSPSKFVVQTEADWRAESVRGLRGRERCNSILRSALAIPPKAFRVVGFVRRDGSPIRIRVCPRRAISDEGRRCRRDRWHCPKKAFQERGQPRAC